MLKNVSNFWFSPLCALCVGVGTLLWALQVWAAPFLPLLVALAGAIIIISIILLSRLMPAAPPVHAPTPQDPTPLSVAPLNFEGPLALHIAPLALAVLVCATWLLAPVRQHASALAGSLNLLTTQAMQDDPSASVRIAACQQLLKRAPAGERERMLDAFYASDELRADCLQPALNQKNPLAQWTATQMAQRWRRDLYAQDGPASDESACQVATRLAHLGRPRDRIQLLRLSLATDHDATQDCFTHALGDTPLLATIAGPASDLPSETAHALLTLLTDRVFFDRAAATTGWASNENQQWVWELACHAANSQDVGLRHVARDTLAPITMNLSCDWSPNTTLHDFRTVSWPQLCTALQPALSRDPSAASLCPVVVPLLVETAVLEAQSRVAIPISRAQMRATAQEIASTPVGAGSGPTQQEINLQKVLAMTPEQLYGKGNFPKRNQRQCVDIMARLFPNDDRALADEALARMERSGLDCNSFSDQDTIGSAYQRMQQFRNSPNPQIDSVVDRRPMDRKYGKAAVDDAFGKITRRVKR